MCSLETFFMGLRIDGADPATTKLFRTKFHILLVKRFQVFFKVKEILQSRSCHATFLSFLFPV